MMKTDKLGLSEAGRRVGLSRTTVERRIEAGLIKAEIDTDTGFLVIDPEEIDRYMRERFIPYDPNVPRSHRRNKKTKAKPSQTSHKR